MTTEAAPVSERSETKPALLFVDDERRVLTSMRAMFRREYDVLLANSGLEAIEILADKDVSVVVSDQRMPEMTGVELLSTVKEEHPGSMRILLTGYADLAAVEASINESEVFRYLMKPCPTDELKDAVRLAVQAARVSQLAGVDELAAVPEDQLESIEMIAPAEEVEEACEANDTEAVRERLQQFTQTDDALESREALADEIEVDYVDAEELAPELVYEFGEGLEELNDADDNNQPPLDAALENSIADAVQVERADPEVLVLTHDADLLEGVHLAVGPQYSVRDADSIDTALTKLSQHPVGVLITDLAVNSSEIDELTRTLKHEVPELVTIIASERSDASLLIGLINHGQIFRFLLKPLQVAQTRIWLNSAMAKYEELCADSQAVLRHRVARSVDVESANRGLFASVRKRIKTMRKRISAKLLTSLAGASSE